ncbi:MAG: hypothetical protein J6Q65_03480 [Lentisphaeria bacterium]|nr:hypothetical protein [Lentisphaeria bacterium]
MHHYSEHELEQFRNRKMNLFYRQLCKFHLWHCAECTEKLNALDEDELIITDLRKSLNDIDADMNEDTYNNLCEHFSTLKGSTI